MTRRTKICLIGLGILIVAGLLFAGARAALAQGPLCRPLFGTKEDPRDMDVFMQQEFGETFVAGVTIGPGITTLVYGNPKTRIASSVRSESGMWCIMGKGRDLVISPSGAKFLREETGVGEES
jgi:hypothetical protein